MVLLMLHMLRTYDYQILKRNRDFSSHLNRIKIKISESQKTIFPASQIQLMHASKMSAQVAPHLCYFHLFPMNPMTTGVGRREGGVVASCVSPDQIFLATSPATDRGHLQM